MEDEDVAIKRKVKDAGHHQLLFIPRRTPSVVIPPRKIIYITPDKITCVECTCFPKEAPYVKPQKLNQCQKSPLTLLELAAAVVNSLEFPDAFSWSVDDVADWMEHVVGLPEYRACVEDNYINGMRLLMWEDPSHLPIVNIHDFEHMKKITGEVRKLYSVEFVRFTRSIGLPPRKPLTHCTWFKSRTGPSWGIRQNWIRSDILRWMQILMPEPLYLDHWDLVWYLEPEFPRTLFARVPKPPSQVHIPHYRPIKELCHEYQVSRKFRLQDNIPETAQLIWTERRPASIIQMKKLEREQKMREERDRLAKITIPRKSRLDPKKVELTGLVGREFILAKRKMPTPKYLFWRK